MECCLDRLRIGFQAQYILSWRSYNGVVDKHYTYGYYGCGFNSCVKLLFFLNSCLIRQDLGSGWRGTWWILSLFDFISFQFRKYFLDFPKSKSGVLKRVRDGVLHA